MDELVKRLRICPDYNEGCVNCPHEHDLGCRTTTMHEAADAIEELRRSEAVTLEYGVDEHNRRLALEQKPRWIPVTERLPEEMETVLVTDGKNVGWSFCVNDYGTMEFYSTWEITHWMPLPTPPTAEEGD